MMLRYDQPYRGSEISIVHSNTAGSEQNEDKNRTEIIEGRRGGIEKKNILHSESLGLTALQAKFRRRRHISQPTS